MESAGVSGTGGIGSWIERRIAQCTSDMRGSKSFFFQNPKFLLLVVPANLRKLYCGHFGI